MALSQPFISLAFGSGPTTRPGLNRPVGLFAVTNTTRASRTMLSSPVSKQPGNYYCRTTSAHGRLLTVQFRGDGKGQGDAGNVNDADAAKQDRPLSANAQTHKTQQQEQEQQQRKELIDPVAAAEHARRMAAEYGITLAQYEDLQRIKKRYNSSPASSTDTSGIYSEDFDASISAAASPRVAGTHPAGNARPGTHPAPANGTSADSSPIAAGYIANAPPTSADPRVTASPPPASSYPVPVAMPMPDGSNSSSSSTGFIPPSSSSSILPPLPPPIADSLAAAAATTDAITSSVHDPLGAASAAAKDAADAAFNVQDSMQGAVQDAAEAASGIVQSTQGVVQGAVQASGEAAKQAAVTTAQGLIKNPAVQSNVKSVTGAITEDDEVRAVLYEAISEVVVDSAKKGGNDLAAKKQDKSQGTKGTGYPSNPPMLTPSEAAKKAAASHGNDNGDGNGNGNGPSGKGGPVSWLRSKLAGRSGSVSGVSGGVRQTRQLRGGKGSRQGQDEGRGQEEGDTSMDADGNVTERKGFFVKAAGRVQEGVADLGGRLAGGLGDGLDRWADLQAEGGSSSGKPSILQKLLRPLAPAAGKALAWNYAITLGIVLLGGALIVLPVTLQVSGLRGEVGQLASALAQQRQAAATAPGADSAATPSTADPPTASYTSSSSLPAAPSPRAGEEDNTKKDNIQGKSISKSNGMGYGMGEEQQQSPERGTRPSAPAAAAAAASGVAAAVKVPGLQPIPPAVPRQGAPVPPSMDPQAACGQVLC